MKYFSFILLILMTCPLTAQVGINTNTPDQALDVNGKLKIGDDSQTPTPGTMRFNSSTNTFEGYNGTEWVSMNNSPAVYAYEQNPVTQAYTSTVRDVLIPFPNTLTIAEPGKYLCLFDITFFGLTGNTTSLSSDRSLYVEMQVYNQVAFRSIGPDITGLPNGFTYFFRNYEYVQLHRIIDIPVANQTMQFRYRVNSNTCCAPQTTTYRIRDVKMTAVKLD